MGLVAGTKLGPYEILSQLGAGGMGEVYRARDTRLDRDVAVKVLPAHLASDPLFKQRFEREARTVSSLNHPHICTLYDIGREGETDFLVMEYLEGETLAARLKRGKLPLPELVKISLEIADALEKAHRKGVVHRDLKPGNIMLTKGGAKLMDFGLAKPTGLGGPAAGSVPLFSAAMTVDGVSPGSPLTSAGTLVGTVQYMSPEQIEGKEADPRSDLFAFGSTLYEMATGEPAFQGKSQISVASAILEKEPEPISTKQPLVPAALDRVVAQCLAKDPDERFQNAHDVGLELKWVGAAVSEPRLGGETPPQPRLRRALPWAVSAVFLVLAVFFAFAWYRPSPAPVQSIRALITAPEGTFFALNTPRGAPVLSPDGTRLVFRVLGASGREALWVRPLDSLTAQPLQGTEGGTFPFWAPDSRQLGYFQGGKLKKIDVTGGPPVPLCDAPNGRGGAWGRNNVIVIAPQIRGGLSSVPAAGGTPTAIAGTGSSGASASNRWPVFLPDGRHFLYLSGNLDSPGTPKLGIHLGEVGSNEQKFLLQADSDALYAAPGYLLFLRGETLMAQRFDAGSLKLEGEAFPVAEHVPSPRSFRLGLFSVSQTGLLVYATGGGESGGQLVWMDASGKEIGKVGQPGVSHPTLSSDGTRLAYEARNSGGQNRDIWLMDLARDVQTRFTFGPGNSLRPIWSPDGARIAYASPGKDGINIFVKNASGAGNAETLLESDAFDEPSDWSRDGRYILFTTYGKASTGVDLWVLPLFGERKPFLYLQTQFSEGAGVFSPDGHWVAYRSNESGSDEVYLSPFPPGGGKWQVSQGGGVQPEWNRDGSALYYLAPDGKLMEARVRENGPAVEIGTPRQLFQKPLAMLGAGGRSYAVAPDGKRFLVDIAEQGASPPLTLVTNWTAGLKR